MDEYIQKARDFLFRRSAAYRRIFLGHGPDTNLVLGDLAKFCRAHTSTFHPEASMSDRLDGRREVWLRIAHHLRLSDEQVWELYGGNPQLKESDHATTT